METIEITIQKIKEEFLFLTREHASVLANGRHKNANILHKKIQTIYDKAKEMSVLYIFSDFLNVSDENVRLWGATFSINTSPEKAKKVLMELSKSKSITGISAKMTLDLWKKGMLNLL